MKSQDKQLNTKDKVFIGKNFINSNGILKQASFQKRKKRY